jgi:hypothetical protein
MNSIEQPVTQRYLSTLLHPAKILERGCLSRSCLDCIHGIQVFGATTTIESLRL